MAEYKIGRTEEAANFYYVHQAISSAAGVDTTSIAGQDSFVRLLLLRILASDFILRVSLDFQGSPGQLNSVVGVIYIPPVDALSIIQ